ncbi:MAG TPA: hypothetical protein VGO52_08175 [Hyphomonadaceae bacterium]|jgi:hypothetical protein|nr:hypothetical protein [Hyphomonadaceae bacterium]
MFDTDDRTWIEMSTAKQHAEAEVIFLLKPDFYKGDDKKFNENRRDTVPISAPAIGEGTQYHLNSRDVIGHERELAAHYETVLELARKFGKKHTSITSHFWLRLVLVAEDVTLGFPWYDTWQEMEKFLNWAELANDGVEWFDIDQGWEMVALRAADRIHVRQGDGEEEEFENVSLPRDALLDSIAELKGRAPRIINRLIGMVGKDYWTTHIR